MKIGSCTRSCKPHSFQSNKPLSQLGREGVLEGEARRPATQPIRAFGTKSRIEPQGFFRLFQRAFLFKHSCPKKVAGQNINAMKNIYKNMLTAGTLLATCGMLSAQNYVHQVIVLNEGYFNFADQVQEVPVSFGSFDPADNSYTHIGDIDNVRFASDVEVDDQYIYIAADTLLLTFDKNDYQPVASTTVHGIRKIALWNDQVLVSKGDIGGFDHYFEARDRSDLSLIYELDTQNGPEFSGENIEVLNNVAYIAINNGFEFGNYVGRVGMIDLVGQSYDGFTDLGVNGTNPENIMISDGQLYTLNNKDFSGSSISKINLSNGINEYTDDVALNSSCGTSAIANDVVYYQEYAVDKLARYDVSSQTVIDTLANSLSYYGMINNELDDVIYGTSTDYVTEGFLHIMQYDGTVNNTIAVGVSPGNLALDVRTSTSIEESGDLALSVSPNPANDQIFIQGEEVFGNVTVVDIHGRTVLSMNANAISMRLDISELVSGVYFIQVEGAQRMVKRIVKQ